MAFHQCVFFYGFSTAWNSYIVYRTRHKETRIAQYEISYDPTIPIEIERFLNNTRKRKLLDFLVRREFSYAR